jgi:hypothetical protein
MQGAKSTVFEFGGFAHRTEVIAHAVAQNDAFSIAGGGDTLAAIAKRRRLKAPPESTTHLEYPWPSSLSANYSITPQNMTMASLHSM